MKRAVGNQTTWTIKTEISFLRMQVNLTAMSKFSFQKKQRKWKNISICVLKSWKGILKNDVLWYTQTFKNKFQSEVMLHLGPRKVFLPPASIKEIARLARLGVRKKPAKQDHNFITSSVLIHFLSWTKVAVLHKHKFLQIVQVDYEIFILVIYHLKSQLMWIFNVI